MKSENIDQLAIALAKAQAEMPAAPMNATNPFLKNNYADLGMIIKTATPVLVKNGLAVSQQVVSDNDRVGVTTTLLHTSGQWIESTVYLPLGEEKGKSLAQVAGSVITYLRRYSFGAIIGLYTDEDVDGNHPRMEKQEQPATTERVQPKYRAGDSLTLEQAENELNSKGVRYGDLETSQLSYMHKTLIAKEPKTDEHYRKIAAIELIMKARNGA